MNDKTLSIIIKAQDEASKVLTGVGSKVEEVGAAALKYGKIAAAAFGAAAVATTAFGIKSSASFEQTRIGLENILGSAGDARDVLKEVSKFAAQTPFEFPELAASVRQLAGFGFNAKESIGTMKMLGDVSAAIGAPIGDLSYLMGTLHTQGRAMTVDLRQFASRGVPIYKYLAQVLGTNTAEINNMVEAGKIGFPEVQKAFEAMTAEGGQFHGAMAAQSKSLTGLWSTLKDNVGFAIREMMGISTEGDVKAGSLFDKARIAVGSLNDYLNKIDWSIVAQNVSDMAGNVYGHFLRLVDGAKKVYDEIANRLQPSLDTLKSFIQQNVTPVLSDLKQKFDDLSPVMQLLVSPIATLATNFSNLGGFVQGLKNQVSEMWYTFSNSTAVLILSQFFQQVVVPALQAVGSAIRDDLAPALGHLWDSVQRVWQAINPLFTDALKVLGGAFVGAGLFVIWFQSSVINLLIQALSAAINWISNIIGWISNFVSWMGNLAGIVRDAIPIIINAFQNLVPNVREVFNIVIGIFSGMAGSIGSALSGVPGTIGGVFRSAKDSALGFINEIINKVKALPGIVVDSLSGAGGAIRHAIASIDIPGPLGSIGSVIPGFAGGTSYAPGGMAWVGEKGPELVNLPRGSQVYTNEQSSAMATGSTFNMYGNITLGSQGAVDSFFAKVDSLREMAELGAGI